MATDDSRRAMQEWRWKAYRDHLEDLGYDLDGNDEAEIDVASVAIPDVAAVTGSAEDPRPGHRSPVARPRS